jgi:hypothetical protein
MDILKRSNIDITFDSVHAIDEALADTSVDAIAEKRDTVKRNVDHLQIVKSGSCIDLSEFSADQFAEIDAAIVRGNSYISSL